MRIKFLVLLSVSTVFICSCSRDITGVYENRLFAGFYYASITLNNDSSFVFEEYGCLGGGKLSGKWKKEHRHVWLATTDSSAIAEIVSDTVKSGKWLSIVDVEGIPVEFAYYVVYTGSQKQAGLIDSNGFSKIRHDQKPDSIKVIFLGSKVTFYPKNTASNLFIIILKYPDKTLLNIDGIFSYRNNRLITKKNGFKQVYERTR